MKGTLHTDSIPLCESSDDANSVEVICFTIHNTNPCHQSSHTITFYLSIVSAVDSSNDDSIYSIAFKEIRESLSRRSESLQRFLGSMESISRSRGSNITCVGLLKSFVCDYLAHTQTALHGNQNSDQLCLWCDTMTFLQSTAKCSDTNYLVLAFDSSNFKVVDSH